MYMIRYIYCMNKHILSYLILSYLILSYLILSYRAKQYLNTLFAIYYASGVTLAQLVKASVGQADVQRFEPHLGYN